ncbi:translation initiation factor IF-3 [Clostridium tarantellae]|uniref:Translation initiation factor IF-3 n=1 Tax=Clostridium tarantellae TaxID=39493 RepID=A0A6I1MQ82_9CLOT|nr:translation initiation factor IF-3 [Clostridium tarantellae]MPQ44960.1 translation initiation factor IF-3 [Clostridium tarantellae]
MKVISKKFICNEYIKEKEIRLINSDGSQLGVISTREAQNMADEKELDLVMISPTANPPVCKIMDLGKFIYEQSKKEKESKKNQKVTVIKEIRCSLTIEENDILIKAKNARKFLLAGDKVKITVRFKGREAQLGEMGKKILEKFVSILEDVCVVEKGAKQEGRNMSLMVSPKKA